MNLVYYGERYYIESGGELGTMYDELTGLPVTDADMARALVDGEEVHIRPAAERDVAVIETQLAIVKARQSSARPTTIQEWIESVGTEVAVQPAMTYEQMLEFGQIMKGYGGKYAH